MNFDEEIYHHERKLNSELRKLDKSEIPETNRQIIREFVQERLSGDPPLSKSRAIRYLQVLREFAELLEKNFTESNVEDVKRIFHNIETRNFSPHTVSTIKAMVKRFYKWLRKDERPPEVSWFKNRNPSSTVSRKDLLEKEEIEELISSAKNPRDRALICLLYEAGARIGEVLRMQVKHVMINKDGTVQAFIPKGKTFAREILLPERSGRLLKEWIQQHSAPGDPESPLWMTLDGRPMPYSTAKNILKSAAAKSGILKRVYPYKLRHTRATKMAELGMSDAQMKTFFGWTQGSSMQQVYVHLSGRDLAPALKKLYELEENGHSNQPTTQSLAPNINSGELVAQIAKEITNKLFKNIAKTKDEDDEE